MKMIKFDIQMFGGRGASSSSGGRKYDGSVSLSSYGKADAYKASKIRKGDILLWNYGSTSKVIDVKPTKSGKSVEITTRSSKSGEKFKKTYKNDRLLAITKTEAKNEKEERIKVIRGRAR